MSQDYKKIAMLMLCHTLPNQINDFIDRFDNKYFDFFLHVDKKSDIQAKIRKRANVWFVPDERRVDVRWGSYSVVQATLILIELALVTDSYDYFWLCSGQDFPIKSDKEIYSFLQRKECNFIYVAATRNNPQNGLENTELDKRCEVVYPSWLIGRSFFQRGIKKLFNIATGGVGHTFKIFRRNPPLGLKVYFGFQWWCLNRETIAWLYEYVKKNTEICDFFEKTLVPDESFFHTLVMNSPYRSLVESSTLVYMDWSEHKSSPKVLKEADYELAKNSGKLIARKIDSVFDPGLYKKLTRN